jgi:simple sugar transport system substrate-binding protein
MDYSGGMKMKLAKKALVAAMGLLALTISFTGCQKSGSSSKGKVKAGFVYVGPKNDGGWTSAHANAVAELKAKYDWLEVTEVESVPEGKATPTINQLFKQTKNDVVFTTSFGFMDETAAAAPNFPKKILMHCSGFKRADNLGTYFSDLYQIYYLNGLMAGALTKSGKVGYVAAFPTSEVIRHIDAFALGVKATNPKATVDVRWINAWYDPTKAKEAAEAMIASGVDALAFTEDSASVVETAEASTKAGKPVYSFGHYNPMQDHGEDSVVSGQMVNWTALYDKILNDIHNGTWKSEDLYWTASQGAALLGSKVGEPVNQKFIPALQAKKVKTADLGQLSVYDLVLKRYEQVQKDPAEFEPFTGPIVDQKGETKIAAGAVISHDDLVNINYFVDNVIGKIPESN